MRRLVLPGIVFAFFMVTCLVCYPTFSASSQSKVGFAKPYTWLFGDWVTVPRIPMVGDINGDGYADFLYASAGATSIDCALNGQGWKPLRGATPIFGLPQGIVAACVGHFGGKGMDIAVLGDKGRLSKILNGGSGVFTSEGRGRRFSRRRPDSGNVSRGGPGAFAPAERVAYIADVKGKVWLLAVKADTTKATADIAVITAEGRVRIYDVVSGKLLSDLRISSGIKTIAAGDMNGDGVSEIVVHTGKSADVYTLVGKKITTLRAPKGQPALAVGDTNADGRTDLLCNGQIFLGPDFKYSVAIEGWKTIKKPVIALMADVAGHGRADVIIQHQGPDYFGSTEADCNVYFSYLPEDTDSDSDGLTNAEEEQLQTDPLDRDTDYDGLPDGWEVKGFAGFDFPGMGATPRHKDIFVMNLPTNNTPSDQIEKSMKEYITPFFAKLPYKNLDGTQGFALHFIMMPPASEESTKGKGWSQLARETFPKTHIGMWHWMQVYGMGGGGQSGQLADAGGTGMGSWIHEFGHQLGLSHSGKWAGGSPTYTSLMNYTYSYSFDGSWEKIHFSDGEFASAVLNESHLMERLPFPIERLHFLGLGPYRFRMKADGPKATLIDWNWNGVFDKKPVKACITYGYAVSAGAERLQPSGTKSFNYDGPYELMTDYQASLVEHKGKLYMFTANRGPVEVDAPRPVAELVVQTYLGNKAWTKAVTVAPQVVCDPSAISDGKTLYVFYPTPDGIAYRFGQPDAFSEAQLIPDSKGMQISTVNWKGTIYAFFYEGKDTNITYRTVSGKILGPIMDLGIKGTVPPGLCVDTKKNQLLLGTGQPAPEGVYTWHKDYRWQLYRLAMDTQNGHFKEISHEWLGGEKAGWSGDLRPTLIFDTREEAGPEGRIYWIGRSRGVNKRDAVGNVVAQTTGYKDDNNGWRIWRYYDEWTNTRSGIGAAWYKDNIIIATTWASGSAGGDCGVYLGYYGLAISNVDMGDFDDISLMANYGMARSIGSFSEMPPAVTGSK